jgi:hypothetical protein
LRTATLASGTITVEDEGWKVIYPSGVVNAAFRNRPSEDFIALRVGSEELIRVSSSSSDPSYGNKIFGSSDPVAILGLCKSILSPSTVGIGAPLTNLGGFAISDLQLTGTRTRFLQVNNNTASVIYAQIHSNALALSSGDIPVNGFSTRIPANSSFILGAADLEANGTALTINPRVGLSSTFSTYTAIMPANTSIFAQVV